MPKKQLSENAIKLREKLKEQKMLRRTEHSLTAQREYLEDNLKVCKSQKEKKKIQESLNRLEKVEVLREPKENDYADYVDNIGFSGSMERDG